MKDGTYVMCSTSPEQSALHVTGAIRGGVDTVHRREQLVGDVMCCVHLLLVHCVLRWSVSSGSLCDLFICCLHRLCDVLVCFFWFIV